MKDQNKTKAQLIAELEDLRQRFSRLEEHQPKDGSATSHKRIENEAHESEDRGRRQRNAIVKLTLGKESLSADLQHSFEKACEILSETIDVARSSVWELSDDGMELRCFNLYETDKRAHSQGMVLNARDLPKYFNAIKSESRIYANDVQNDPRTNELTENYLKPLGITSMLDAGIVVDGQLIGVVCSEHIGEMREWHSDEESFVSTVAAFIAQLIVEAERRQAQEKIRALNEVLKEQVNELEAKNTELTQFTYTVSHDLKSPLVTINGFLGYLEQDSLSGNTERLKKDINRIREAVNKMDTLLTELLELSRIGRMMNPAVDVPFDELVKDALDIVHGQIEKYKVTVQTQPGLPIVHGDRQRLTEILQNLIDNATKYMGDQTDPLIEIGQQGTDEGKSVFFVRDNGIGIAPEYHERIFGLFNKLDARSEGTGVGLALVKRIIEFHGGRIWVNSKTGKGTTFYFTLPPAVIQMND